MANPKFLNIEKKVPYNLRLPPSLIDELNAYAEITGNTTTNIINKALADFIADKTVRNDYLNNIGGVSVKIPYAPYQKKNVINGSYGKSNLESYGDKVIHGEYAETYFTESFVIKRISNNLDIIVGDSYAANKNTLQFNQNAKHSGIEFFIYPGILKVLLDEDAALINSLYCLYFEVSADESIKTYLIDYLTAINLLSASGNEIYKNLLISCVSELNKLDELFNKYLDKLEEKTAGVNYPSLDIYDHDKKEVLKKYKSKFESGIAEITDKYNSGNIVRIGDDDAAIIFDTVKFNPEIDINRIIKDAIDESYVESVIKESVGADIEHIVKKVILKLETDNELETIKAVSGAESDKD